MFCKWQTNMPAWIIRTDKFRGIWFRWCKQFRASSQLQLDLDFPCLAVGVSSGLFSCCMLHLILSTCREHGEGRLIWPYHFLPHLCRPVSIVFTPLNSQIWVHLCNEEWMQCSPTIISLSLRLLTDCSYWHSLIPSWIDILYIPSTHPLEICRWERIKKRQITRKHRFNTLSNIPREQCTSHCNDI